MAFALPKDILRELRRRLENTPHTLSLAETAIAQRIRLCERCEWVWIHRTRHEPRRCPHCGTTAWNMPLIDLLRKAIPALLTDSEQKENKRASVDAPTPTHRPEKESKQ
jgi:hypothetical protein